MIEMKITANNIAELHETIRAILPDQLPSISSVLDEIASEAPVTTALAQHTASATQSSVDDGTGVDTAKHPWDERIHSTKYGKTDDGIWKIVRRPKRFDTNPVEWKVYVQDVLNELSGDPVAIDPTVETENPEPQPEIPANVFGGGAPQTIIQPINTSSAPVDLSAFLLFMTGNSDKISTDQVIAICQKYGVPELMVMYEPQFTNAVPLIFGEVQATINAHG